MKDKCECPTNSIEISGKCFCDEEYYENWHFLSLSCDKCPEHCSKGCYLNNYK